MAVQCKSWFDILNLKQIRCCLLNSSKENYSKDSNSEAKRLMTIWNGNIFVWDSKAANIIHSKMNDCQNADNEMYKHTQYQVLMCTDTPYYNVDNISVNGCGSHVVLWAHRGVHVMELPLQWGRLSLFEGGEDVVLCKTVLVAAPHLSRNQWIHVRQVRWHPGSPNNLHLAILTSDNIFSVYRIPEAEQPFYVANIQSGDSGVSFWSPSKMSIVAVLGETAVDFTFASPVSLDPVRRLQQELHTDACVAIWPVYFLRGNGDIMVTYSDVIHNRPLQMLTYGPLVMCPAAEDNYGFDACSILCLNTALPVLVIATCDGHLHHCLPLSGTPEQGDDGPRRRLTSSDRLTFYQPDPPVLYVVETVKLELLLTGISLDLDYSDTFTCPIKLIADPLLPDRYHCSHSAGLHSVALPWVFDLHTFLTGVSGEFVLREEQAAVVEHVICTRPLQSSPPAPILGLDIVSNPNLGHALLVLTSDLQFTAILLRRKNHTVSSSFLDTCPGLDRLSTDVQKVSPEPFSQHVAEILHRTVSSPLFRTNPHTGMSQHQCYQLLMRVTKVLREEYIQRQEHAQEELETRVKILTELKKQEFAELKALEQLGDSLRNNGELLENRLRCCQDQQQGIVSRMEIVRRKIQSCVPFRSMAERKMASDLTEMQEHVEMLRQNVQQLQTRQECQQKQFSQRCHSPMSPQLRRQQVSDIKDILREEGEEIAMLLKQVKQLQLGADL